MDSQSRERAALLAFFLPLTSRTCDELAVGDQIVSAYLADVLVEFPRSNRLFRIHAPTGRPLTNVAEMLSSENALPNWKGSAPSAAISATLWR